MMYDDLTFVIPIRAESPERLENLQICVRELLRLEGAQVIVLEADRAEKVLSLKGVQKIFIEDVQPVFHHTRYRNMLIEAVETPFAGVWDADAVIPERQIREGLAYLRRGEADMIFPDNGFFYNLQGEERRRFIETGELCSGAPLSCSPNTYGAAFMVNKACFIEAGGENENFYGWGPEDVERAKRWEILGYNVRRMAGIGYHLDHPRYENSRYWNEELKRHNIRVLLDTCRRSPDELRQLCRFKFRTQK